MVGEAVQQRAGESSEPKTSVHSSRGEEMDIYQLDYILHEPEESEGWMYLAEVPTLQGCMAWGDNPRRDLEKPFGSRLEHHPAPEGKRGTAAPGDNPPCAAAKAA